MALLINLNVDSLSLNMVGIHLHTWSTKFNTRDLMEDSFQTLSLLSSYIKRLSERGGKKKGKPVKLWCLKHFLRESSHKASAKPGETVTNTTNCKHAPLSSHCSFLL